MQIRNGTKRRREKKNPKKGKRVKLSSLILTFHSFWGQSLTKTFFLFAFWLTHCGFQRLYIDVHISAANQFHKNLFQCQQARRNGRLSCDAFLLENQFKQSEHNLNNVLSKIFVHHSHWSVPWYPAIRWNIFCCLWTHWLCILVALNTFLKW